MKTFHTMTKEEWQSLINYFHPIHGSHYIDLPNGRVLVAVQFSTEWAEESFHALAKTKTDLPHPVWQGTEFLGKEHLDEVGHLVAHVSKPTVHDVIRAAAAIHPLMKLSGF